MSSAPESSRMCKDAGWSSALKHVLLLFERGLYSPVTVMLPWSWDLGSPGKWAPWLHREFTSQWVAHHVSFLSALGPAMSYRGLLHLPGSGNMGEVYSLPVTHSMKNICENYFFFFSCCNSTLLMDTINLPSIRKKTLWLAPDAIRL